MRLFAIIFAILSLCILSSAAPTDKIDGLYRADVAVNTADIILSSFKPAEMKSVIEGWYACTEVDFHGLCMHGINTNCFSLSVGNPVSPLLKPLPILSLGPDTNIKCDIYRGTGCEPVYLMYGIYLSLSAHAGQNQTTDP